MLAGSIGRRAWSGCGRLLCDFSPSGPECDLAIVGTGPEARRLQQQVKANHLAGRVHTLGGLKRRGRDSGGHRHSVLPSRWEGMPNVILEAMATGLPVVTRVQETFALCGRFCGGCGRASACWLGPS